MTVSRSKSTTKAAKTRAKQPAAATKTLPGVRELSAAGVHFGHQHRRWNPAIKKYIFTVYEGIDIFDLGKTGEFLGKACEFLKEVSRAGGDVLFVGVRRQAKDIVAEQAKRSGSFYINERWIGGLISNFEVTRKNWEGLKALKEKRESGGFKNLVKKERLMMDREIASLERLYGGLVGLKRLPSAIVIVSGKKGKTAVDESSAAGIPVVGLVDSNISPRGIAYPIPGNDDARKSIELLVGTLAEAIIEGRSKV